mmetsp:Transcript_17541/g.61671  ORF Transcript_17541/g.61671 Transcript_17541/m.61671 type:complete len:298 (-) Transcript_17541:642-1535(-)
MSDAALPERPAPSAPSMAALAASRSRLPASAVGVDSDSQSLLSMTSSAATAAAATRRDAMDGTTRSNGAGSATRPDGNMNDPGRGVMSRAPAETDSRSGGGDWKPAPGLLRASRLRPAAMPLTPTVRCWWWLREPAPAPAPPPSSAPPVKPMLAELSVRGGTSSAPCLSAAARSTPTPYALTATNGMPTETRPAAPQMASENSRMTDTSPSRPTCTLTSTALRSSAPSWTCVSSSPIMTSGSADGSASSARCWCVDTHTTFSGTRKTGGPPCRLPCSSVKTWCPSVAHITSVEVASE